MLNNLKLSRLSYWDQNLLEILLLMKGMILNLKLHKWNKRSSKGHKNRLEKVISRKKQKSRFQNKSSHLNQVRNKFYKRILKRFLLISLVLVFQANWSQLNQDKQELLLLEKLQNNHQNLKIRLYKRWRKVEEKLEKLPILQNKLLTH